MDELEARLSQLLSHPEELSHMISLARSFGLSPPEPPSAAPDGAASGPMSGPPAEPPGPPEAASAPQSPVPPILPLGVAELLQEAGRVDSRQAALFNAIKPYLKPERRKKIDRALRIGQLSHVAGFALKKLEHKL